MTSSIVQLCLTIQSCRVWFCLLCSFNESGKVKQRYTLCFAFSHDQEERFSLTFAGTYFKKIDFLSLPRTKYFQLYIRKGTYMLQIMLTFMLWLEMLTCMYYWTEGQFNGKNLSPQVPFIFTSHTSCGWLPFAIMVSIHLSPSPTCSVLRIFDCTLVNLWMIIQGPVQETVVQMRQHMTVPKRMGRCVVSALAR